MKRRRRLVATIRETLTAFRRDNATRFGAALAFYFVFSLTPMLLMAIAVAGAIFGRAPAERAILKWIGDTLGVAAGTAIATLIRAAVLWRVGWLATVLGFSSLYFGLAGIYRQIDDALRTIWREGAKDAGVKRTFKERLASMALVGLAAIVVLAAVIADGAITIMANYTSTHATSSLWAFRAAQLVASAVILTALFAMVFRFLTQPRLPWRDVSPGAAMTAILFVIGKFALGVYLGKAAVGSPFGAAGSIVVVLLWAYWSAQILFFGLEFTHVYARQGDGS